MSKFCITVSWEEAPHLTAQQKADYLAEMRPHERKARTQGLPYLGAGAVFAFEDEAVVVSDFPIPDHWTRAYGLDVGWKETAAVFCAHDRDTDTKYLYATHQRGEAEPVIHAAAIKAKGDWMTGMIDPASRQSSQKDGEKLLEVYKGLGLHLKLADNAVEAGIEEMRILFSSGRLKVFKSLENYMEQFRMYHRNEKGIIVKENDHLIDASRYVIMASSSEFKTKPVQREPSFHRQMKQKWERGGRPTGWMAT